MRLCSLLIKKTIAAQSTGVILEQDKSILLLKVLFFCRSDAAFSTIVASLYSCKHFIIRTASCLDLLLNVTESQRVMYVKESQRRLTKLLTASFVCPRRRPATNWSTKCHFGSEAFVRMKLLMSLDSIFTISLAARNSWRVKWMKQNWDFNLKGKTSQSGIRLNNPQSSIPFTSTESNISRLSWIPVFANDPTRFKVSSTWSGRPTFPRR